MFNGYRPGVRGTVCSMCSILVVCVGHRVVYVVASIAPLWDSLVTVDVLISVWHRWCMSRHGHCHSVTITVTGIFITWRVIRHENNWVTVTVTVTIIFRDRVTVIVTGIFITWCVIRHHYFDVWWRIMYLKSSVDSFAEACTTDLLPVHTTVLYWLVIAFAF